MRSFLLAVVFAVTSLAAVSANAASYFVSTSGNDASNGSISTPFRTITKAATVAAAGDVINVRGGVYNEVVKISSKGNASARIVFQSYSGETAVIDGNGTAADTNLVQFYNAEYVDFQNFEVRNATKIGVCLYPARNVRILNNNIHSNYTNGIYAGYSTAGSTYDITIEGNSVHDNVLMNQYHTLSSGGWSQAIAVKATDRSRIVGNRVYNNDGEGIVVLLSDGALVQSNEVRDNFSVGIYLDNAQGTTVNGNFVYSTNSRYYRDGHPAWGIAVANETYSTQNPSSDNKITNNIVVMARAGFLYSNTETGGGLKNTTVSNNTFYNATMAMLKIDSSSHSNSVIENNIFAQASSGVMSQVAGAGVTYRNNNWYGGSAGTASGAGDIIGDPRFVRAGGNAAEDYRLTSISPAIQSGFTTAATTTDYFGGQRTAGFDIGAHELSISSTPVPTADTQAPTAPASLTVTGVTTSSASLSWGASSDNVGVTMYNIYRNGAYVTYTTSTNWTDSSLSASTTYQYYVVARDAAGNQSAASSTVSATTAASTKVRRHGTR